MQAAQTEGGYVFTLLDTWDADAKLAATVALYGHNVEQTGLDTRKPIGARLADAGTGEVLGGL